jgi:hypothetical protein
LSLSVAICLTSGLWVASRFLVCTYYISINPYKSIVVRTNTDRDYLCTYPILTDSHQLSLCISIDTYLVLGWVSTDNENVSMSEDLTSNETGNTTPTEDNKMMASFRIDRELWAKFGKLAKSERLTATDVLTEYIQRCTDNDKTQYAVNTSTEKIVSTGTYDDTRLNDAVMTAIGTLSLPDKDAVMMMVSTAIETSLQSSVRIMIESALAPIEAEVAELKKP